jgi:hypothetical protein
VGSDQGLREHKCEPAGQSEETCWYHGHPHDKKPICRKLPRLFLCGNRNSGWDEVGRSWGSSTWVFVKRGGGMEVEQLLDQDKV